MSLLPEGLKCPGGQTDAGDTLGDAMADCLSRLMLTRFFADDV